MTSVINPGMLKWFYEIYTVFGKISDFGILEGQIVEFLTYETLRNNLLNCLSCFGNPNPDNLTLFKVV